MEQRLSSRLGAFLTDLNARCGSNSAFVAIAIAGPVGASDEMIFPTSANDSATQPSGMTVDATWAALIQHSFPSISTYQNTDQAFIDAWKQAIDASEGIFNGVTLFIGADAGNAFPNFSPTITPHPDNTLFAEDCSSSPKTEIMSCEAKTDVLSYFVMLTGPNQKATQVGGMTASSPATIGNIGVQGVKVLTALSPPFLGGAEFDQPVSGPTTLQSEGCPNPNGGCTGLTVEEAAYNVMTVFFTGTPAAEFYGGTVGTAPIQYLEVPFNDLQYALANPCPSAPSPTLGYISLQDLYARASRDLFAMANQVSSLPPLTCLKSTFFTGEVWLGSGVYYLQFPNGNLFGYYNLANFPIFYHFDMGYEAFIDGGNGAGYVFDFTTGHWFYTSSSLFPYLYDFTLSNWLYYLPATNNPGHYTTNPRYFSNLGTGKIITM